METHLVVSAVGKGRPRLLQDLARAVLDSGCSIGESRMTVLGSDFAIVMLLSGNWNAVAKLESLLPRLGQTLEMTVQTRRTERRSGTENLVPYAIEIVAVDRPGIVHDVATFFARRDVDVEDVHTSSYPAPHTGAAMFSLHMTVGVPSDMAIAALRGEFMDYCDELNVDAMLAPVK